MLSNRQHQDSHSYYYIIDVMFQWYYIYIDLNMNNTITNWRVSLSKICHEWPNNALTHECHSWHVLIQRGLLEITFW
jgi:hypothetical protein